MARSTRCQPQRRCTTKGRAARARLPLWWTRRPVIITMSTTPMKKAVPAGNRWIRLCTAADARYTGSVLGSWGTGCSFLICPASQIRVRHATQIGKTRVLYEPGKTVASYLAKVGGIKPTANEDEIYLVQLDGTVLSNTQNQFAI